MTLGDLVIWHHTQAQRCAAQIEGQRWTAVHNPTRWKHSMNRIRNLERLKGFHEDAVARLEVLLLGDLVTDLA